MALSDLTNPDDPYRKSLESALYGRQSDAINTAADKAQNDAREGAFSRGVGFSSILPDYSTAPIERERARGLSNAAQNAFLGAGQEARANAQATNQPLQFAQSQGQQASQFQQMMRQQQKQLSQNANQNLMASLAGGSAGLASLLLRPNSPTGTLGGSIYDTAAGGLNSGLNSLSELFAPAAGATTDAFGNLSTSAPDIISSLAGSGGGDLASLGGGATADTASQIDPETLAALASIFGF